MGFALMTNPGKAWAGAQKKGGDDDLFDFSRYSPCLPLAHDELVLPPYRA